MELQLFGNVKTIPDLFTSDELKLKVKSKESIGFGPTTKEKVKIPLLMAGLVINKVWQGVNGIGYAAGMYMNIASQDINVRWASTDYVMEKGGVL
jgi:hypothetical protein